MNKKKKSLYNKKYLSRVFLEKKKVKIWMFIMLYSLMALILPCKDNIDININNLNNRRLETKVS